MLCKTRGILLHSLPFKETSVIIKVFTEDYGLQSYLLNGIRKIKGKLSPSIIQPLHFLEIVAYYTPHGELHRVKEIKNHPLYTDIPFNIIKSSVAIFLTEVLLKSIKQHQKDLSLFEFLWNSLQWYDHNEQNPQNFHLLFLLKLSRLLGFFPSLFQQRSQDKMLVDLKTKELMENFYFDLKNGEFLDFEPNHPYFSKGKPAFLIFQLCTINFEEGYDFVIKRRDRAVVMDQILDYFAYHIEGFYPLYSLSILKQVFEP